MTTERWQRVKELFEHIQAEVPERRVVLLDEACGSDRELRIEVESLLQYFEQAGEFLQDPALPGVSPVAIQIDSDATKTATEPDPYLGNKLNGRYIIDRQLGRGGFGVVYLGRDTQLHDRPIVIKILLDRSQHSEWSRKKFRQECEALARIHHPGVVGVLDRGKTADGRLFLAMDFVDGVTLRSAIEQGPMDLQRVARLIRQIGQALHAAHKEGVYHRDLKPANIIVRDLGGGQEFPVIIDFGVATVKGSETSEGQSTKIVGSFPYMAPEQHLGRPEAASDVYALGVISYQMITGRLPFEESSPASMFAEQQQGVRVLPKKIRPDLPAAAQDKLLKALSFVAKQRPSGPLLFCEELAQALVAGASSAAEKPGAARPSWILPVVFVAAAMFLSGMVLALRPRPRPPDLPQTLVTTTGAMVLVPAGTFLFGEHKEPVSLPAFYIDKTEVTNASYGEFCKATHRNLPPGFPGDKPSYPVVNVSILDARDFTQWAGKRLPTTREWEKAARGVDGRSYPWGNGRDRSRANINSEALRPADDFVPGSSPFGALQMVGNAWELVDQLSTPGPQALKNFGKKAGVDQPWYTIRGQAFTSGELDDRVLEDLTTVPAWWSAPDIGFRCVRDAQ